MSPLRLMALLSLFAVVTGCLLPKTTVVKDPGPCDKGVRYYRPKPYLMVAPMTNRDGEPVPGFVTLETSMLPDFREEYSIHVRPGIGTNETRITLSDGWNLTGLNVNVDSKVSDNLSAIADVVGAVPIPTRGIDGQQMTVKATNVPMGLYEAVISSGPDGRKRLYGFRYVGFLPYESCPVVTGGETCQTCMDGNVYGLVFDEESGAMIFRQLETIHADALAANDAPTSPAEHLPEEFDHPAALIDDLPAGG